MYLGVCLICKNLRERTLEDHKMNEHIVCYCNNTTLF